MLNIRKALLLVRCCIFLFSLEAVTIFALPHVHMFYLPFTAFGETYRASTGCQLGAEDAMAKPGKELYSRSRTDVC